MKAWLVDTGPLVAYLHARDPSHSTVVECLDRFTGELHTTSAVITETMHFVSANPAGPHLLADLVASTGLTVFDLTHLGALRDAASLMEKYADLPMDFADATLVLLAAELDCFDILTLDRRGFRVFRTRKKQSFHLVLDDP